MSVTETPEGYYKLEVITGPAGPAGATGPDTTGSVAGQVLTSNGSGVDATFQDPDTPLGYSGTLEGQWNPSYVSTPDRPAFHIGITIADLSPQPLATPATTITSVANGPLVSGAPELSDVPDHEDFTVVDTNTAAARLGSTMVPAFYGFLPITTSNPTWVRSQTIDALGYSVTCYTYYPSGLPATATTAITGYFLVAGWGETHTVNIPAAASSTATGVIDEQPWGPHSLTPGVGAEVHQLAAKTTLANTDEFVLVDSEDSNVGKKITWANISAAVSTTIAAIASAVHGASGKTTPVDADELALVDSADSYGGKKLTWANAKATLKTYFDTLYMAVVAGSNDDILQRKAGAWTYRTPVQVADDLPIGGSVVVPFKGYSGSSGTWIPSTSGVSIPQLANSSATNGDYVQVPYQRLPAGTYTATLEHVQGASNGRIQVAIDGTDIGTYFEGYAASSTHALTQQTGLTVTGTAYKTIKVYVNGKHASSSGYTVRPSQLIFTRTA